MPSGRLAPVLDPNTDTAPPSAAPAVDPEVVREQCARILADPLFNHSKRYSGLLQYIVDHTLDGKHGCLKERILGIEVFGRSPDYNTSTDSTVRGAVTEVRKRLGRYYEASEHDGELRIDLPAGSYVAEFNLPLPEPEPFLPARERRSFRSLYVAVSAALVLLAIAAWGIVHYATRPAIDRFWAPVLSSSAPVVISIGSPASDVAQTNTPLAANTSLGEFIGREADFPIADIRAANAINSFLSRHGRQSGMRLAQTTTLSDLRGAPVVILGSYLNQWAMRLGSGLRFQFEQEPGGTLHWIEDTSDPGNRSWSLNLKEPYKQVTSEYALVTRKFDSTTGQWWIGIGGASVLGTLAAQQMFMDPAAMTALSAQLPRGWEHKNLQVVLKFDMVDGSLGASHVVATYSW